MKKWWAVLKLSQPRLHGSRAGGDVMMLPNSLPVREDSAAFAALQ